MEMTNTGELSIDKQREYVAVDDGTWEAEYKGFKPFKEDGQWGHKEGVRLQFRITKGPWVDKYVSFKGNFFQDNQTGKWVIGRKSKLAEVIRQLTGGVESINKGHEGTRVFVTVVKKIAQTSGKPYSMVTAVIPMPRDYAPAPAPQQQPAYAQQPQQGYAPQQQQTYAQQAQPAPRPAPQQAPAQQAAPQQPYQAPAPQQAPAQQPPAQPPAKNKDLLDELSDLSDFGN